ncbi:MAG TPA: T9SS type A sorting domain-containing protein [Bacteroidia bacterium]|nr:T9SS type A sorting domain-containing protein [Bacteroidia bacterium]
MSVIFLFSINLATAQSNFNWVKQLGGLGTEVGTNLTTDNFGNVYTVGWFEGTVDFDPGVGIFNLSSSGDKDVFISKLNSAGSFVWAKKIGGTSYDYSKSIFVDINGNIFIIGNFKGSANFDPGNTNITLTSSGIDDIFISKFDSLGNHKWTKKIGGLYGDIGQKITGDKNGNIYCTGYFTGTVDFDPGTTVYNLNYIAGNDIFILKLNTNGDFVWVKQQGGNSIDQGLDINIDNSGYIYTTGVFQSTADFDPGTSIYNLTSTGGSDVFISKLDSTGRFVWARKIGGTSTDLANSISIDASNNIYITGYFWGTSDFDPSNTVYNLTSTGLSDIFISKFDSAGNYLWAKKMGGTSYDQALSVINDSIGHVFTTGYFSGTCDFDPSNDTLNLISIGASDSFISCLDSLGNSVWAKSYGSTFNDVGYGLSSKISGSLYSCGGFQGTIDFDFSSNVFNLTSIDSVDTYIFKLSDIAIGLNEKHQSQTISFFPNPAQNQLNFDVKPSDNFNIELFNNLGQLLINEEINSVKKIIDIHSLANGIYFIKIIDNSGMTSSIKFIKNN